MNHTFTRTRLQSIGRLAHEITIGSAPVVSAIPNSNFSRSGALPAIMMAVLLVFALPGLALENSSPSGFSNSSPNLLSNQVEFLPVEKAYRLTPTLVGQTIRLDWDIAPGYYLYKDKFFARVEQGEANTWEQTFEPGQLIYDEYYEKNLEVYYDRTQVTLSTSSRGGVLDSNGVLAITSQGCADAGLCYPPRTQYLSIDFDSRIAHEIDLPPIKLEAPSDAVPVNSGSRVDDAQTEVGQPGLWVLIGSALLGGLILNLMPCVFPVLSIKVLGVTSAHLGKHDKHSHGLAYAAGVILSFVAIAAVLLVLRRAGSAIGWGFQLQSPIMIAALAYLFFLMAQGFNGQFTLGARLMNLGQASTAGGGLGASFMTGVLATIVASPCTAPFMGTALGVAITQPATTALFVFGALGLGMASPFLLLTWMPRLTESLPSPGPWMETFRQFLAFPLYASVIWLLWILGRQTDVSYAAIVALGLLLLALATWLFARSGALPGKAIASLLFAAGLSLPVIIGHVDESTDTIWEPYTKARLEDLRSDKQAVFINLTADWCITCLANEKLALNSVRFKKALQDNDIYYLKGDWTNRNPEITHLLGEYGRNGVPLYLFFPAGGEARILPQLLTEKAVLRTIEGSNK